MVETIQWTDAGVVMIDQTKLPRLTEFVTCTNYEQVAEAIRSMVIRGAPAIGVAAAMGVAIGMTQADPARFDEEFAHICSVLAATRPTAVNLFWGIERMKRKYASLKGSPPPRSPRHWSPKPNWSVRKTSRSIARWAGTARH